METIFSQASESNEIRLLKNHVSSLECELQRLRATAGAGHLNEESQAIRDRDATIARLEDANAALDRVGRERAGHLEELGRRAEAATKAMEEASEKVGRVEAVANALKEENAELKSMLEEMREQARAAAAGNDSANISVETVREGQFLVESSGIGDNAIFSGI